MQAKTALFVLVRGEPNGGLVPNLFSYFWLGTDRKQSGNADSALLRTPANGRSSRKGMDGERRKSSFAADAQTPAKGKTPQKTPEETE